MIPSGKYGLQLRMPIQRKKPTRLPCPPPLGFQDDEEDDVEGEIARQASKKKSHRDVSIYISATLPSYFTHFQHIWMMSIKVFEMKNETNFINWNLN